MDDPGLGLTFPPQWVEEGLASGRFQRYELPKEIYAGQSKKGVGECCKL